MTEKPPDDPADHAEEFSHRWADKLDWLCTIRMQELGIPEDQNGAPDFDGDGHWRAFDPNGRTAGNITSGIYLNSGIFNRDLLQGKKGARVWAKSRLRDRLDATIAHEWEERRHSTHEAALKAAAKTDLPISEGARRICRAMGR
jgi:hypothetical protein